MVRKDLPMRHAVIVSDTENFSGKLAEASLTDKRTISLAETEYSSEELETFDSERFKWILRCKGSRQFLADSDSGEDAVGYYCGYCDPVPERAVFEDGKLVGIYFCSDGFSYSGRGRYNFSIDDWGFPGSDPFDFVPLGAKTHVFLFSDPETHRWGDWSLLERDPDAEYKSYLDF